MTKIIFTQSLKRKLLIYQTLSFFLLVLNYCDIFTSCRHVYAIGNAAYEGMLRESSNQVVVISGESGAGKTETAKLLVQFLAATNHSKSSLLTEQVKHFTPTALLVQR